MGRSVLLLHCSASLFLVLFFSSASCNILWEKVKAQEAPNEAKLKTSVKTSTVERDITTPLTTVPTINIPPISTTPILKPNSIPEDPQTWVPLATPTPTSPTVSGASWCIASQTAGSSALQTALDYACGKGGANCSEIQPGGTCYNPNSLVGHASYAFNDYYQKNPIPNSCNFGGTAVITSTNPSSQACQYPSTSTSSSVLDTANQNVSTVFGVGPPGPASSATHLLNKAPRLFAAMCLIFLLLRVGY